MVTMKILLTGATGFLGRNLLLELLNYYKVRCITRNKLDVNHKNLEIISGDITNKHDVDKSMKDIDYAIHAAAVIQDTDEKAFNVNVNSTKNLIGSAKKFNIKKFIFISTENVIYDYCQDAYTNSKREAEKIVETFKNYLILRPSVIYGKDDDRYVSYMVKYIKRHFIVPILGYGKNLIQPVYVKDLSKCIINSLKYNIQGTYTVCGADSVSYRDIVKTIKKTLNLRRFIFYIPLFIVKPMIYFYEKLVKNPKIKFASLIYLNYNRKHDISHIIKVFKYKPTALKDGIKEIIS